MKSSAEQLDGSESRDEALTILVEEQGARLFSLGLRFCGNAEEAHDLVQETFLAAYKNWAQFQGRSSAATWLYTIAARACQRLHRKRSGEPDRVLSLEELLPLGEARMAVLPDHTDGPVAQAIRAESQRAIEAAIASLPLEFRMPLVLTEVVGLSLAETGLVLDLEYGTVKTRLHRARLRIRKALEEVLPTRDVPPPIYSKQICLDLLQAKQETLDRGLTFEFPDRVVCERCAELFATLDLAHDVCQDIARGGELPESLRAELLAQFNDAS